MNAVWGTDDKEPWPERHLVGIHGDPVPFHMAQQYAWESVRRIVGMVAGTQSGKTAFGPWWMGREIEQNGGGDYLVVTSSYPLFKLKLLPSILQVFEQILGIGRYWAGDKVLEIRDPETGIFQAKKSTDPMYARIIMGAASAANALESSTAKAAWMDEPGQDEFTLQAYQAILRRLSLHQGRQLLTTTLYNLGWVKSHIIDKAKTGGKLEHKKVGLAELDITDNEDADICLIQFDSTINPEFSQAEFERAQREMAQDEFAMFYRGRVAKLRSMIYDVVDDAVIVPAISEVPRSWAVVVGVDPLGQKTAAVVLGFDPVESKLHVVDEYEGDFGLTTTGHVHNVLRMVDGLRVALFAGGGPSENQARIDWTFAGINLQAPPAIDVWSQISKVYSLFKTGHLVIHANCERLISDLQSMRRKKDAHGNLTDIIENKDIWHLPDALRYIINAIASADPVETRTTYDPIQIVGY